ncbi:MAG: hypothetical protein V8K32_13790 [Candidatus Electrothrix gigas]
MDVVSHQEHFIAIKAIMTALQKYPIQQPNAKKSIAVAMKVVEALLPTVAMKIDSSVKVSQ